MNQKELKELIEFIIEKDIAEFELERGDVKLRVRRGGAEPQVAVDPRFFVAPQPQPVAQAASAAPATTAPASPASASPPAATTAEVAEEAGLHIVRSPIVGTFYEAASPGAPPFVKPGDTVAVGQVLCIIEAMKMMNNIDSEYDGTLVRIYAENGQPVQFGERLFAIKAR